MLCSDFRAPRKNDPLLPHAGTWRNNHVYEGKQSSRKQPCIRAGLAGKSCKGRVEHPFQITLSVRLGDQRGI
jgi:hypothetical protein